MSIIRKADRSTKIISEREMNEIIKEKMKEKICWSCGKYLGSMLYFDFGRKIYVNAPKSGKIQAGESALSIRECYWQVFCNNNLAMNSDRVSDENSKLFLERAIGTFLAGVSMSKDKTFVDFVFSNNFFIRVDATNFDDSEDAFVVLITNDGMIYNFGTDKNFHLDDLVSAERADR